GLTAACFVKAFGITFLAMPRSEAAARGQEPHWCQRASTAVMAGGCVVLGLIAPRALSVIGGVIEGTAPNPLSPPPIASGVWLLSPTGIAQVSPVLIAVLLLSLAVVGLGWVRRRGIESRRAD